LRIKKSEGERRRKGKKAELATDEGIEYCNKNLIYVDNLITLGVCRRIK
jgi:hypothetical protein